MDGPTAKQFIVEKMGYQIEWRVQKSAEYPDDTRNLKAVEIFETLINEAGGMEDDDPLFCEYSGFWTFDDGNLGPSYVEAENEHFRQVGFGCAPKNARVFIGGLVTAFREVRDGDQEFRREEGE